MEKFNELSLEEVILINGGMDSTSMQLINTASETWWWKGLNTINDAVDFVSGWGDGFLNGFSQANKSWH
jgi:hypothetical protein